MICKYQLFLLTVTSFQLSCLWSCLRMQLYCSDTSRWWIHTGSRFWICRELQHRGRSEGLFSATVPSGREPHYGPSPCPQAPQHHHHHPPLLQQPRLTVMPPALLLPLGLVVMSEALRQTVTTHKLNLSLNFSLRFLPDCHDWLGSEHSDLLLMFSFSWVA